MSKLQTHLRNTFLTGIFVVVPVGVTLYIVSLIESKTREATESLFHHTVPYFVGILLAIVLIYISGLVVTSIVGKWLFKHFDRVLRRVPGLNTLYESWKQIALTPGGTEGTFSKVVLIPSEVGGMQLGFTSGRAIEGHASTWCVFVPNVPNPITGRLHFLNKSQCMLLNCSTEEAFKVILSTGNYVPPVVGMAIPPEQELKRLIEARHDPRIA